MNKVNGTSKWQMAKDRHERVCRSNPQFPFDPPLNPKTAGGHYIKYQCDLCALINVYTYEQSLRAWDLVVFALTKGPKL